MRPLFVTARGTVSAIGRGGAATLEALLARRGGLAPCDFAGLTAGHVGRVAGVEAHRLPAALARFDCRNHRLADMALRTDGFLGHVEAARARHGAGRIAVVAGTSTSGVLASEEAYARADPATGALPHYDFEHTHDMFALARFVRAALGLRGPAMTVSTACASSARAFVDAAHLIAADVCDAAVVGGADSLCRLTLAGFAALDLIAPDACRPCDAARAGISVGEAAGFVLLERAGDGLALLGHGASSDGHHMSAPHPEAKGAIEAMRDALRNAGLRPEGIGYVNLHGTGTRANDAMEDLAVATVLGTGTPCSSTKGWTGHALGAAGVLEAEIAMLCVEAGLLPGCLHVATPDPTFRANVLLANERRSVGRVLSNSFGFGGANCSLVFGLA